MNKKGSILMISLWILSILVVFAVGLGHRAAINLKLSRYQRDRLKAYSLAMAGVKKSIAILLKGDTDLNVDSLDETWSTGLDASGKPVLENVEIIPGSGEKFTVRYYNKDKDTYLCMSDEEAKINLNTADANLLSTLFQEFGLASADTDELVKFIRIWRGDDNKDPALNQNDDAYKDFKKAPFVTKEELLIVLECFYQNVVTGGDYRKSAQAMYSKVKDLIACYADSSGKIQININTASSKLIEILIKYCIVKLNTTTVEPLGLLDRILTHRQNYPAAFFDVDSATSPLDKSDEEKKIATELKALLDVKSDNFRIISTGEISATGIRRNIDCVFNRDSGGSIVYWHEN